MAWPDLVGARQYGSGMADRFDGPQTLYQAWSGWGPFKRWEHVGVTNSPSRRMREHRANSDWWLEARVVRLKRYPERPSVLEAERLMIKTKRPRFNIQHNLDELELHVTAEDLAAVGAAVCFAVLALRWLADTASMWWVGRLAAQQDVPVSLPPRPNRFTESSLALTLFESFSHAATGQWAPQQAGSSSVGQFPALPDGGSRPAASPVLSSPVPSPQPSALSVLLVLAYYLVSGHGETAANTEAGSRGD